MQPESYAARNESLVFARRTGTNLSHIEQAANRGEDVHVVTQLVNSLLGLVLFPWEKGFADGVRQQDVAKLTQEGWPEWSVTLGESQRLGDLLYRLRNGIAHGHLRFLSDSPLMERVTIRVWDLDPTSKKVVWRAEIQSDHLRDFCYQFVDLVEQTLG